MNDITFIELRAIAHHFGDNISSSLRRAFLLITLFLQYISELYDHRETIERHSGFIARNYHELSVLTGISKRLLPEDLAFLEGKGLIEYRKGLGIRIKVKLDNVADFIEMAREEYSLYKEREFNITKSKREASIAALQNMSDELTRVIVDMDPTDIESLKSSFDWTHDGTHIEDAWLVYLFSHYYKRYTGEDYIWTVEKLRTLKYSWKGALYKRYPEFGLSRALKDSLNDKSKRPLEKVWREKFNADFNTDPYTGQPITDVIYEALLR